MALRRKNQVLSSEAKYGFRIVRCLKCIVDGFTREKSRFREGFSKWSQASTWSSAWIAEKSNRKTSQSGKRDEWTETKTLDKIWLDQSTWRLLQLIHRACPADTSWYWSFWASFVRNSRVGSH